MWSVYYNMNIKELISLSQSICEQWAMWALDMSIDMYYETVDGLSGQNKDGWWLCQECPFLHFIENVFVQSLLWPGPGWEEVNVSSTAFTHSNHNWSIYHLILIHLLKKSDQGGFTLNQIDSISRMVFEADIIVHSKWR